jgi:hypothetical protein
MDRCVDFLGRGVGEGAFRGVVARSQLGPSALDIGQSPWVQADLRAEIADISKAQEERHAVLLAAILGKLPSDSKSRHTPRQAANFGHYCSANPGNGPQGSGIQADEASAHKVASCQHGGVGLNFEV